MKPYIGSINASKLTPRAVESAYSQLQAKGYAAGTLKAAHRLLSVAYRDAVRLNEIPTNLNTLVNFPLRIGLTVGPLSAHDNQSRASVHPNRIASSHNPRSLAIATLFEFLNASNTVFSSVCQ